MTARIRGPLAAACLIALTFAASAPGTATAGTTSSVGWIRLAQLSPDTSAIDWYLTLSGSASAQVVVKDVAFGSFSPYEALAPGNYVVAIRAAGNAPTGNPMTTMQVTVVAGQAYTVAGFGPAPVPTLQVLNDKLDTTQGKADVRVLEASQRNPAVSVAAGGTTIAANAQFPSVTDYQTIAAGPGTLRVSTQAASSGTASTTTTVKVNFAPASTYTVVVLDGSGSAPQVLDLSDASGVSVPPKGGVNTGFGGTAGQQIDLRAASGSSPSPSSGPGSGSSSVFPVYQVVLLIAAGGAVAFGISRRRRGTV